MFASLNCFRSWAAPKCCAKHLVLRSTCRKRCSHVPYRVRELVTWAYRTWVKYAPLLYLRGGQSSPPFLLTLPK